MQYHLPSDMIRSAPLPRIGNEPRHRLLGKRPVKDSVIRVSDFRKCYGDLVAVDGISFNVTRGEIFGLLGPNGAGKTTTMECLEGLRFPDGGSLQVMGIDPARQSRKLRNLIGVQLQTSGLPEALHVDEAMKLFCAYHGIAPRCDLLVRLGLEQKIRAQYRQLSTGLQRRLALALALAHAPPVLLLDEPTAGLDVPSRVELHRVIRELQSQSVGSRRVDVLPFSCRKFLLRMVLRGCEGGCCAELKRK